jgi:hypothetical protein
LPLACIVRNLTEAVGNEFTVYAAPFCVIVEVLLSKESPLSPEVWNTALRPCWSYVKIEKTGTN